MERIRSWGCNCFTIMYESMPTYANTYQLISSPARKEAAMAPMSILLSYWNILILLVSLWVKWKGDNQLGIRTLWQSHHPAWLFSSMCDTVQLNLKGFLGGCLAMEINVFSTVDSGRLKNSNREICIISILTKILHLPWRKRQFTLQSSLNIWTEGKTVHSATAGHFRSRARCIYTQ